MHASQVKKNVHCVSFIKRPAWRFNMYKMCKEKKQCLQIELNATMKNSIQPYMHSLILL